MTLEDILNMEKSVYTANILDSLSMEIRLKRIAKRQLDSSSMFSRLQLIIDQIEENFKPSTVTAQISPKDSSGVTSDHNYASSNTSSGVSSASSSPPPTSLTSSASSLLSSGAAEIKRFKSCSAKRKIIDDEQEYHEFSAQDDHMFQQHDEEQTQEYPKQIDDTIILGPNGTQINQRSYSSIIWSSAASATRQLLGFVFTSDILATHTLTGKPSPAFYGRERPAKLQLDPIKAADIIHCVRSKFKCSEREIRAAITTKCSDTSKKYKRRHQKQLEYLNVIH